MGKPHRASRHTHVRGTGSGRGFSLVELLVVIGIIAILIALAVVTGSKVISGGKARATQDVIRVLDQSRDAWMLNWDKPMPESLEVENAQGRTRYFPLIDARLKGRAPDTEPVPSLLYYTALVLRDPAIRPVFEQLDSAFVKPDSAPRPDQDGDREDYATEALAINDAWGRPIRFVHPAFHGGHGDFWNADAERMDSREPMVVSLPTSKGFPLRVEYQRSYRPFNPEDPQRKAAWIGDGDEGMCVGNTPYFYSPGEDGDPGTRADNVYTSEPRFPVETRGFK